MSLEFDPISQTTILVSADSSEAFVGVLRLAIIPPTKQQQHDSDSVTSKPKQRSTK
jgi:hypothetical protein